MGSRFAIGIRATKLTLCMAAALVVSFAFTSVWTLSDARAAARRQAEQAERNVAFVIEAEVARIVNMFDRSLQAAVRGMSTPGLAAMDPEIRQTILFNATGTTEGSGGLFITDATGRVIYDSAGPIPRRINVADRTYFKAHAQQPDLGLFISPPVHGLSNGHWALAFSRRINNPDGSFAGVAVVGLQASFFQSLFVRLDLGQQGVINILNTDGVLIARRPSVDAEIGHAIVDSKLFAHLSQQDAGSFVDTSKLDGVRRLYSYRKVENLPLVVGIGLPLREVYAEWTQKTVIFCLLLLVPALIGVALAVALRRELCRRLHAERLYAAARLDTVFRNSADMMVVARAQPDGRFVYESVNQVWERISGVPAAAAIGQPPERCLPPALAASVVAAWQECTRIAAPVTFAFTQPDGAEPRAWEAVVAPVIEADGTVGRIVSVARDMTERNLLDARLRQSHRLESVGQLTAGIAHDFNNLLQGILGALEIVQDQKGLSAQTQSCVEVALNAAQRGATLVHRLLAYARKQKLEPKVLRPEQVVKEIGDLLRHTMGGRVQLETIIVGTPWMVTADAAQLQDCLLNLALNARDAMSSGGTIRLRVSNVSMAASAAALPPPGWTSGDYTCFAVEDDGCGMSPATLERALEPFFTTKPVGQGSGLGLAMVQGFARQSGGDLSIESELGRGTTVRLWLPRATGSGREEDDPPAERCSPGDFGRGRVLVVDDEEAVRQTLSVFLSGAGYSPFVLEDGREALRLLTEGEPCNLLVVDQSMPGLTGSQLIGELAVLRPDLPTMLITGYEKVSGLDELQGRVTVLRKPFKRSYFLAQIHALLSAAAVGVTLRVVQPVPLPAPRAAMATMQQIRSVPER